LTTKSIFYRNAVDPRVRGKWPPDPTISPHEQDNEHGDSPSVHTVASVRIPAGLVVRGREASQLPMRSRGLFTTVVIIVPLLLFGVPWCW
jgi:hypothetical protein